MVDLNKEIVVVDESTGREYPAEVLHIQEGNGYVVVQFSGIINKKVLTFWTDSDATRLYPRSMTTPDRYQEMVVKNKVSEKWCVAYKYGTYGIRSDFTISPRASLAEIKHSVADMYYANDIIGYYEMVSNKFVPVDEA